MTRASAFLSILLPAAWIAACVPHSGDSAGEPVPSCPPITGPTADLGHVVSAGGTYRARFLGGSRICSQAYDCGPTWYYPFVTVCYRDGPCDPHVRVVRGPPEATGSEVFTQPGGQLQWRAPGTFTPGPIEFEVLATGAPACPAQTFTWSVEVIAPPRITRFDVPSDVRAGAPFTVTAEFDRGTATFGRSIGSSHSNIGVLATVESGVPFESSFDWEARGWGELSVTDEWGAVTTEERSITAWLPPLIDDLSATSCIQEGGWASLTWSVSRARSASIEPLPTPSVALQGSLSVSPSATSTYVLTASNPVWDPVTRSATVLVAPPPKVIAFVATPASVPLGGQATITATFEGCSASLHSPTGGIAVSSGVPVTLPPQFADATYSLHVWNGDWGAGATARLDVPVVGAGTFATLVAGLPIWNGWGGTIASLDGGKLLVTCDSRAMVVDDATGEFSTPVEFAEVSVAQRSARLADGRVLVAGGRGAAAEPYAIARLVDPVETTAPVLQTGAPRPNPDVIALPDGSAIVLAGSSSFRVDPTSGLVTRFPDDGYAGCLLADGRILSLDDWVWVAIDPTTLELSASGMLPARDAQWSVACLRDGTAIIARSSGTEGTATELSRIDPASSALTVVGTLETPPRRALALRDGRVLLLGDRRGYAWDPSNGVIAPLGFYPALQSQLNAAAGPDAAQLDDGRVAVFRGTQVEIFTP